jgi:predicted nucleic acid-binding protein
LPKKPRVYVDTSVVGGCCDEEFAEWSLRLFEDFQLGHLLAVVSEVTEAELVLAPPEVQERYARLLETGVEVVTVTAEAEELAGQYPAHGILSETFRNDALHIAIATAANVDVLVSWNFKHIVRFDKIRQFNAVSIEAGYKPIQIFSPREVTYEREGG